MVRLLAAMVRYLIAVVLFLTYIGLRNPVLDLVLALQTLPTARLLPSSNNRGTLFGDLSRFNLVVGSDDFDIKSVILLGPMLRPVISVTEVNLARVPRALEGEVRGVVASRGRVNGGCGVKVAVRGYIEASSASTCAYPIFLACKCVSKPHRRQPNGSLRL
jgi:hypothetical protein